MFDNHQDSSQLYSEQQLSKQPFDESMQQFFDLQTIPAMPKQATSPFLFPRYQQSISEIAPETHRSPNNFHLNMMGTSHNPLRSSLDYQEEDEHLYGFVMGTGSVVMRHHLTTQDEDANNATGKTRPILQNYQDYFNEDDDSQIIPSVSPLQQQKHYEYFENKQHLIVWGRNQLGQLSLDPKAQNVVKNPVSINLSERIRGIGVEVKQVSCGKTHTLIMVEKCNTNFVYSFGCNKQGQLGISKNIQFQIEPALLEGLSKVSKVECSKNSSFAIANNSLYSWGSNKHGLLGLNQSSSNLKHSYNPEKVIFPSNDSLLMISAGGNHFSALVQREDNEQQENILFIWGSNKYSQLGLGDNQPRYQPSQVNIPNEDFMTVKNKRIMNVSCGDTFTIVSTINGELYSCGSNLQGQLGLGDSVSSSRVNKFTKLSFFLKEDDNIVKLVASNFSAVLMRSGDMYLWGPTPLGHFNIPKSLQTLQKERNEPRFSINEISLGQSYGLIQDKNKQMYQLGSLFHDNTQRMEDSNEVETKNFSLNLIPGNFDSFACGTDFVVASSFCATEEVKGSVRKGQNQSRSLTANIPKKSFNLVEQSIEYGKQPQFTRYGGGGTQNLHNPSACSSSLSPLRSSVISNRGDFLNKSASIAPNGMIQAAQQSNVQQQLKFIRDSCTPLRDFEPPQIKQVKTPTVNDFYQHEGCQNYQTIPESKQDDLDQQSLDKSPQIPTGPSKLQHRQSQAMSSMPTSSMKQLDTSHHYIAATTLDILIREKQELQHSLNIEIQKRLMAERELEIMQKGQNGQERELRNEIANIKLEMNARQKAVEAEGNAMQQQIVSLKENNDDLTQELDAAKSQLSKSQNQWEYSKNGLEDLIARKAKEIYDLTVQLGCLKEENAQLRRDGEELSRDYEDRLASQQERACAHYDAIADEYHQYQLQSTQEAENNRVEITKLREHQEQLEAKIAKQEEKIKKMSEKIKQFNARTKKNSSLLRIDSGIVQSGSASIQSNANESYVSVSAAYLNREEPGRKSSSGQDQSFTSHQSKKSRTHNRDISGKRIVQDKENAEIAPIVSVSTTPKMGNENGFDATQRLFNPIETPNESQKPQAISFDQKKQQKSNLFKKHQPNANIYQTLSQSMSSIDIIKPVKQQQQENPYSDHLKKKSTGLNSKQPATQSLSVLKTNTSRVVNQMNTIQINATKSALMQKTPTRVAAISKTEVVQTKSAPKHNPQQPSTSSVASAPLSKSPIIQKVQGRHKSKQTSTVSQNPNSTANFQLNHEESSIFDINQLPSAIPDDLKLQPSTKGRSSNYHQQELTLGQVETGAIDNSFDRNPMVAPPVKQQERPILPTVSSTSTLNGNNCGLIMSEMRNKLIDIQNNKQYIEQKIQEYERKLVQLKGSANSGQGSNGNAGYSQQIGYYPYPGGSSNYYQEFINPQKQTTFNTLAAAVNQLTKSSSGLLILNHSRDSGRHATSSSVTTRQPQ